MATRLRSDKGSFVRSPLGAFESEVATPTYEGLIESSAQFPNAEFALNDPTGLCQTFGPITPGSEYWRHTIQYTALQPTPAQAVLLTHTGNISGATWRAADHNVAFVCNELGDPARPIWTGALEDAQRYDYIIVFFTNIGRLHQQINVNTGRFPGVYNPAFQPLEPLTIT